MLSVQLLRDLDQTHELQTRFTRIVVAYSGGVDSHTLLHLASKYFPNVHAMHINHGLQADDSAWQAHCMQICASINVPLQCIQADIKVKPSQSMETAARNARRKAWQGVLTATDLLLLAHHADDQAETILYRLLRGTGLRGLSGMQQISKLGAVTLMRPLLHVNKDQIVDYATVNKLRWIEDHSNTNCSMDRNFLRQQIIPQLRTRWPAAVDNINRAGSMSKQLLHIIDPHIENTLKTIISNDSLDLPILRSHDQFLQHELLRAWLKQHDLVPSASLLQMLMQQVIAARVDAQPQLQIGDKIIKRSQDKLFITSAAKATSEEFVAEWDIAQDLHLPDGRILTVSQVFKTKDTLSKIAQQPVSIRMGVWGRKAKKVFQQHSIPPWERASFPLVFVNHRLVNIVGLWSSPRF
ncbi:MAG TPA: tRNA lysidine(34) synthetase TilS [Gammaproteobacteria bacterium]|nr:tRNA lysidine(34) synthetase TilS [Gammaproteobacteria bacterium]